MSRYRKGENCIVCCFLFCSGSGSFKVFGIFPLNKNETWVDYQNGVMLSEAFRYAIMKVNNDDIMYGYEFRIENIESCFTETCVRKKLLLAYIDAMQFLIGPYSSETSYFASILTDTFRMPSVSYSATYSDFGRYGSMQRYMFRTVPSDDYRVLAALDFIHQSKWNYVSVISSHGYDGERDAIIFIRKLSQYGTCLSSQDIIPKFKNGRDYYEEVINRVSSNTRLNVLVLFTGNQDSWNILKKLKEKKLFHRFTILCIYGCTNYLEVLDENHAIANGTLSLHIHNTEVKGFKTWFLQQKPKNHPFKDFYFERFWENVFKCNFDNTTTYKTKCTGNENLKVGQGYYPNTPIHTVIDAVYVLAQTVRNFVGKVCKKKTESQVNSTCRIDPTNTHKNTRYLTNRISELAYKDGTIRIPKPGQLQLDQSRNGSIIRYDVNRFSHNPKTGLSTNELIWTWRVERNLNTTSKMVEESSLAATQWYGTGNQSVSDVGKCSLPCSIGEYEEHDRNYLHEKCCWRCRKCPRNNIVVNNTCIPCSATEYPDEKRIQCLALPVKTILWDSNMVSIVFILFSVLGLLLTIGVAVVFSRNNANRIVRASGRDLCYTIMVGICMIFVCPFVFLSRTNKTTCVLRGALPGFAFLTCYAPLFLKTNRIYRIFFSARVSVTRPSLVSSQSQFALLFGVLAIQAIVSVVWFTSQIPIPEADLSKDSSYVTVHCSSDANPILMILNLSLSVLFMISCTVLAFKTRHFPKNYNEAKYIGITLYITCVIWSLFLPIFFLTSAVEYDFLREYLMCIICVLIGFVTLCGMFGPKVLMIYHTPPEGTSQGSLPTWYITNSRDNETDQNRENTAFTTILPEKN